ncbi:peptide-methionine (S)-S-oxide reductase, partial [Vibrio sp. 707]
MEDIYFAGGCLWGVQEFMRHLPGVISTEAG